MTRIEATDFKRLIDVPLGVGEGPTWHAGELALYFVDILAPALFCLDAANGALRRWDMPGKIGSFGSARTAGSSWR